MDMFSKYVPKSFCKEFVDIKNNSFQLGMYMAAALGFKPLMDDWIPRSKLKDFRSACKMYGLKVREDVIFLNMPKAELPETVIGKANLTTTSAFGVALESGRDGSVHLFISKDEKMLTKSMWYPVIIKDRVIFSPRADVFAFGQVLGYPECCIRFFKTFNNWSKYSYLYEAYINTGSAPSFLCNPFLKDTSFTYIYHMPCSYSCKKTIETTSGLRKAIKKNEPGFVELIDRFLKMPFLVFYERKFYCFEGTLKGNEIRYTQVYFPSPDRSLNVFGEHLRRADSLRLEGGKVILKKKNKKVGVLEPTRNKFAPEYPFLIHFQ